MTHNGKFERQATQMKRIRIADPKAEKEKKKQY